MSEPVAWVIVAVLACGLLLAAVWVACRVDDPTERDDRPAPLDEFERWDER